jgi:hypothetical protein
MASTTGCKLYQHQEELVTLLESQSQTENGIQSQRTVQQSSERESNRRIRPRIIPQSVSSSYRPKFLERIYSRKHQSLVQQRQQHP